MIGFIQKLFKREPKRHRVSNKILYAEILRVYCEENGLNMLEICSDCLYLPEYRGDAELFRFRVAHKGEIIFDFYFEIPSLYLSLEQIERLCIRPGLKAMKVAALKQTANEGIQKARKYAHEGLKFVNSPNHLFNERWGEP